jgi:metal-responsive CopG/Arc/MetJ family transcriptional regulator
MKRTVVWLTNTQVKALAAMSKKSLAPLSALVRQAVKEFLQDKRKVRASKSTESEL